MLRMEEEKDEEDRFKRDESGAAGRRRRNCGVGCVGRKKGEIGEGRARPKEEDMLRSDSRVESAVVGFWRNAEVGVSRVNRTRRSGESRDKERPRDQKGRRKNKGDLT